MEPSVHYASVIVNTLLSFGATALPPKVDIVLTTIDCESSLNFAKAVTPNTGARRTTTKED